jgi:hypothetical protein
MSAEIRLNSSSPLPSSKLNNCPIGISFGRKIVSDRSCRSRNLTVELQQVVPGKARDRRAAADAAMRSVVVGMKPTQRSVGALSGMMVGPRKPIRAARSGRAFGLAVGARGIGTGQNAPHPAAAAQVGNKVRTVGEAVVSHDASYRGPKGLEVIERAHAEGSSGSLRSLGRTSAAIPLASNLTICLN